MSAGKNNEKFRRSYSLNLDVSGTIPRSGFLSSTGSYTMRGFLYDASRVLIRCDFPQSQLKTTLLSKTTSKKENKLTSSCFLSAITLATVSELGCENAVISAGALSTVVAGALNTLTKQFSTGTD